MKNQNTSRVISPSIRKQIIYISISWTLLISAILLLDIKQINEKALNRAYTYVKVGYEKDILYRTWVAEHGGVYVKVDSITQPNPYLSHIPNRDVIIDSSLQFTLMNPAYLTRQVYELQEASSDVRGHITSLNVIRPENAPDPWEVKALEAFETGITEYAELETIDGIEYFRYMKPFLTEKSCLKCHAHQGYKVNDIRGGVSVSYPMNQIGNLSARSHISDFIFLGMLWLLGIIIIIFYFIRVARSDVKRFAAERELKILNQELEKKIEYRTQALQKSENQYRTLFEQSPNAVVIIDPETTLPIEFNNKVLRLLGYSRKEFAKLKISDYETIHSAEDIARNSDNILKSGEAKFETKFITKKGSKIDVVVNVKVSYIEDKQVFHNIYQDITDIKLSGRLVQESAANINSLIENIEDSIWSVDENLNFLIFNSFFAKAYLTAYNIELQKGMNALDILSPELKEFWEVKYKTVLGGESVNFEFSEYFGDSNHYYQVSMNPIIVGGNITGISAISMDVTDRKLAEIALQDSEKNAHDLIENLLDGVAIADEKGIHNYVNPKFCEITGYSKEELLKMTGWEFTRPEDKAELRKRMKDRVSGKIDNMVYERILVRKDGTEIPIEMSSTMTVWHGKKLPMAILRDISDRKIAEKEINHSHHLMQYVIEHNQSALAVHDKNLNYIYVSKRYLKDYNVKEKDIIGKHHYDVFPDLPQKWRDVHKKALKGITSSAEDDRFNREDGSVDWTRWECRPWHNSDGSIGGIIVYTEVITERKRAEERVKESEANLKALVENREDSIWSVNKNLEFLTFNSFFANAYKEAYNIELKKGLNAIDILTPKLKKLWKPKYEAVLGGESIKFEFSEKFDDTLLYFQISLNPIISEKKITGISAISTNITDRKKIEKDVKQLNIDLDKRLNDLRLLLEVSQRLSKTQDLTEILQMITDFSTEMINIDSTAIYLKEGNRIYLGAATPKIPPDFPEEFRYAFIKDHFHIEKSLLTNKPVLIPDLSKAILTDEEEKILKARNFETLIYVPLMIESRAIGVLILGTINSIHEFTESEINLSVTLSVQSALAIENAKLYKETTDHSEKLEANIKQLTQAEKKIIDLNTNLENKIKKRTKEIESKNTQLEELNKVFIGRELRMAELKEEIKKLRDRGH